MARIAQTALVLAFLLVPLSAHADKRPHKKFRRHHKTTSRLIPPNPEKPDPFFKAIDSKQMLVVDGLEYPVPRNISRKPDASVVKEAEGHEVYSATDPSQ